MMQTDMSWIAILLALLNCLSVVDCAESGLDPPQFKRIYSNFTAHVGAKEIKLLCPVIAPEETQYWWLKDGRQNIDATKRKYRYKPFRYLKIKNVKLSDAGDYTCVASNKAGKIEHTMHLYVEDRLISKPILQEINNLTAYEGDSVTVTCKAISDGSPHFQWLVFNKVNQNMTVLKPKLKEHQYLFPANTNKWYGVKLFLPNVSFADEKEYTCMAGNYMGYDHKSFYLHVLPRKPTTGKSAAVSQTLASTTKFIIIIVVVAVCCVIIGTLLMLILKRYRQREKMPVTANIPKLPQNPPSSRRKCYISTSSSHSNNTTNPLLEERYADFHVKILNSNLSQEYVGDEARPQILTESGSHHGPSTTREFIRSNVLHGDENESDFNEDDHEENCVNEKCKEDYGEKEWKAGEDVSKENTDEGNEPSVPLLTDGCNSTPKLRSPEKRISCTAEECNVGEN